MSYPDDNLADDNPSAGDPGMSPHAMLLVTGSDGHRRECPLTGQATVIGRAPYCDVVIEDGSISRRHARLVIRGGRYHLEDLHSLNATVVAGRPVGEADLADGAVVMIGRSTIELRVLQHPDILADISADVLAEAPAEAQAQTGPERQDKQDAPTLAGDQTTVPRPLFPDVVRPARLIRVTGQAAGVEHLLSPGTVTIGRDGRCGLLLNDSAASRTHATVSFVEGEARIVDLGGRNGTYVNGRRVRAKDLADGDLLQVGTSQFRYAARAGARPRDDSHRRPRRWATMGLILVLGVMIVSGALVWRRTAVPQPPTGPIKDQLVHEHYEAGVRHALGRQWAAALAEFDYVLGLDPTHVEARRSRARAARLAQAAVGVETARRQLREGALEDADKTAKEILQHEPGLQDAVEVEQAVSGQRNARMARTLLFQQAERAFERGALDEAAASFRQVVPSDDRYQEAQRYLGDRLPARIAAMPLFEEGLRAYRAGDAERALAHLDHARSLDPTFARASETKRHVRRVLTQYQTLRRAVEQGERWQVWMAVQRVLVLEEDRGNAYNRHAIQRRRDLEPALEEVIVEALNGARRAEAQGALYHAATRYLAVLEIRPEHAQARQALARLRPSIDDEAKRLYDEAYVLQEHDPERALQQWQRVVELTPADHPYHRKAQAQLERSAPGGGRP